MTKYCESVYQTKRRPTRTVWAGKVPIGSEHRIARQTMTTTDTRDVAGTVDQVRRCLMECMLSLCLFAAPLLLA
jgi:(E)-4-hydroxy-3-methylbut-2-enyl-diphosphate synthase